MCIFTFNVYVVHFRSERTVIATMKGVKVIMKKKIVNKYSVIAILIIIAIIIVYYATSDKKLIGNKITKGVIEETEYLKIYTVKNNEIPINKSITDKKEIRQFYNWISSLKYKKIVTDIQELPPGTEYTMTAYDYTDTPIIIMSYSNSNNKLQIEQTIYDMDDNISNKLNEIIDGK